MQNRHKKTEGREKAYMLGSEEQHNDEFPGFSSFFIEPDLDIRKISNLKISMG